MTTDFLDDQEVTAVDLDNIIAHLLVTDTAFSGFPEFPPESAVSELNNITGALVTRGILQSYKKCKPIKTSGGVTIGSGIIVFNSGAKMKLETDFTIQVDASGADVYVYAVFDEAANTAEIVSATAFPTSGVDHVPICQVTSSEVIDKRIFAASKFHPGELSFPSGENPRFGEDVTLSVAYTNMNVPTADANPDFVTVSPSLENQSFIPAFVLCEVEHGTNRNKRCYGNFLQEGEFVTVMSNVSGYFPTDRDEIYLFARRRGASVDLAACTKDSGSDYNTAFRITIF